MLECAHSSLSPQPKLLLEPGAIASEMRGHYDKAWGGMAMWHVAACWSLKHSYTQSWSFYLVGFIGWWGSQTAFVADRSPGPIYTVFLSRKLIETFAGVTNEYARLGYWRKSFLCSAGVDELIRSLLLWSRKHIIQCTRDFHLYGLPQLKFADLRLLEETPAFRGSSLHVMDMLSTMYSTHKFRRFLRLLINIRPRNWFTTWSKKPAETPSEVVSTTNTVLTIT